MRAVRVGERAEEHVDRSAALLLTCHLLDDDRIPLDPQDLVGRHDVCVVGLEPNLFGDLCHRNQRRVLKNLGEHAVVIGRQMQDDHIGSAAVGRHRAEEIAERLDAAS